MAYEPLFPGDGRGRGAGFMASGRPWPLMCLLLVIRRDGVGLMLDTRRGRFYPVPVPVSGEIVGRLAAIP